jgi:hypothetical protein
MIMAVRDRATPMTGGEAAAISMLAVKIASQKTRFMRFDNGLLL